MKRILLAAVTLIIFSGPLVAQYQTVPSTAYPQLEMILNAKPAVQISAGAPSGSCTAGKDLWLNTATSPQQWSYCSATNTWTAWPVGFTTGSTSQYFRGDLSLATFPTIGSAAAHGASITINGVTCTLDGSCSVSGGGTVASVFGRTGAVVPVSGDYTASQVTNAVDQTGSYSNPAWLVTLASTKITGLPAFPAGTIVGTSDMQTLTGKTISNPSIGATAVTETWTVGTGGVTVNTLVQTDTSAPLKIVAATTGAYGVAMSTVSAAGSVEVARYGTVACLTDSGGATAAHLVIESAITATDCADSGQTASSAIPITTRIIGVFRATASGGATALVELTPAHFGTLSPSTAPYATALFTAQTVVTVPGASHGYKTVALAITASDNSTPRNVLSTITSISINATTFDVIVTFASSTTGYIYINGGSGPQGATGATGSTGTNGAISQIQNNGSNVTVRPKLNLTPGTNTTLAFSDNGTDTTTVSVSATAGAGGVATIEANGSAQTARTTLNLISGSAASVTCADNSGAARTDCTITGPYRQLITISGGSTFSQTITLPSGYTNAKITMSGSATGGTNMWLQMNGVTTSTYAYTSLQVAGTTGATSVVTNISTSQPKLELGIWYGSGTNPSQTYLELTNYLSTSFGKAYSSRTDGSNTLNAAVMNCSGSWSGTTAITTLTIFTDSSSIFFNAGTTFLVEAF